MSMSSKPLSPIRKAWYKWKTLHLPWRKRFLVGLDLQGNTFWEFRDTFSSHRHRMRRIVQYPSSTPFSEVNISPQWHQWLRHTRRDAPSLTEQSQDLVRQENLKVLAAQADARWAAKPSFLDRPGRESGVPLPALGGVDLAGNARRMLKADGGAVGMVRSVVGAEVGDSEGKGEGLKDAAKEAVGWNGEVRAEKPLPAVEETPKNGDEIDMQIPDHKKHYFNERPDGSPVKEKKYKEDPWKQAKGVPGEEWQPQAWNPDVAATRR